MDAMHSQRVPPVPATLTIEALKVELAFARSEWRQLSAAGLPRLAVPAGVIVLQMQTRLLRILKQAAVWEAGGVRVI